MSLYYMINGKPEKRKYSKHGRTKQSYKDSCDINKLLEKHQSVEALSHLEKHGAMYGDFAALDWDNLPLQLAEGRQVFSELPAEIKREFNQDAGAFFAYVTDPENKERLPELLPAIAKRGQFFPSVNKIKTRSSPDQTPEQTQAPEQQPEITENQSTNENEA